MRQRFEAEGRKSLIKNSNYYQFYTVKKAVERTAKAIFFLAEVTRREE